MTPPIAPFLHGQTVEVERGARNDYGDNTYVVVGTIEGCAWAPRTSSEDNQSRTTVIVGLTLYGPYGADLRSDDRVVLPQDPMLPAADREQRTYRVVGEIGNWRSPFTGWTPGFEAALERVS